MIVASIYGYVAGAPWKLIAPIDGGNNICGYTPGYEDYSHLMFGDIDHAAVNPLSIFDYGICVKECPTTVDEVIDCKIPTDSPVANCTEGSRYTTYDFLSYCLPVYDSLPSNV